MSGLTVWIDCTAAAHPIVLRPLREELERRGHRTLVTARSYGQTEGLLERMGIPYESFGSHADGGTLAKGRALTGRSAALVRWARRTRPDMALAHGSVDVAVAGSLLRIPQVQMQDYEYAGLQRKLAWRAAARVMVPDAIPVDRLVAAGAAEHKLIRYPGLKEDYYLADFEPDGAALAELDLGKLGITRDRDPAEPTLVILRPPPESSAYHADNPVYEKLLDRLVAEQRVVTVLIPRTAAQGKAAAARRCRRLVVPDAAVDAQSLIAFADLVISAGGTMNREAVALGVPVRTIFSGRMGAVDEQLIRDGRLLELRDPGDLDLGRRSGTAGPVSPRSAAPLVDGALGAVG